MFYGQSVTKTRDNIMYPGEFIKICDCIRPERPYIIAYFDKFEVQVSVIGLVSWELTRILSVKFVKIGNCSSSESE